MQNDTPASYPKAILFDLLTALLDSWTLWNTAAGSSDAGRAWRAEYLKLTYGCGEYVEYEALTRQAARNVGLSVAVADTLEHRWLELKPWAHAADVLARLRPHCKLAVVTNCSRRLGAQAASLLPVQWDAIVTAEEAGFYKPDPRPYLLTLEKLGVDARDAAFVAGSSYDLFGTSAVGLRTYWHNAAGLPRAAGSPAADFESSTLEALARWAETPRV